MTATWALGSWLLALCCGCAASEPTSPGPLEPSADASLDVQDASHEPAAHESSAPADGALSDVAEEPELDAASYADSTASSNPDLCVADAPDASPDGPCVPGEAQIERCGACGIIRRLCKPNATWAPWSECMEKAAECWGCDDVTVACGYCGTRSMHCQVTTDSCRWLYGECQGQGECAAGDFELDADGCGAQQARVRWCEPTCQWGEWSVCTQPPSWTQLGAFPLQARSGELSVPWGSGKWLIWGGRTPAGSMLDDGAVFDAALQAWTVMPPAELQGDAGPTGSFVARANMAATATDQGLFVFGGVGEGNQTLGDGAVVDVALQWRPLATEGAPTPRSGARAVWISGHKLVVLWGGLSVTGVPLQDGARYHATTDTWSPMAAAPIEARDGHSAVWDDKHSVVIIWGGRGRQGPLRDGALYDPGSDQWRPMQQAPIARTGHLAVWDADRARMVVMFGRDDLWPGPRANGAVYDPEHDRWTMAAELAVSGYPLAQGYSASVGGGFIWVTGGTPHEQPTALGARYDLAHDAWSRLPAMNVGRSQHASAFVGGLVAWSGLSAGGNWTATTERLQAMP